jgi:hypothetical protein
MIKEIAPALESEGYNVHGTTACRFQDDHI